MTAYYNENDPKAAAWLRELIRRGMIAPGDVDERSIEDVKPNDLAGYRQCHFFAGIGIWSYALRCAGVPDDYPVWTGSCPCQPFSAAGKGKGLADERHLWPAMFHLVSECGPELVLGEQVAGKNGLAWLDLVSTDLEAVGYACGAVPFTATSVGAPHIRERLYWMAHSTSRSADGGQHGFFQSDRSVVRQGRGGSWSEPNRMAHSAGAGSLPGTLTGIHRGEEASGSRHGEPERSSPTNRMAHSSSATGKRNTGAIFGTKTQEHSQGELDGCIPVGSGNGVATNRMAHTSGAGRGQTGRHTESDREAREGRAGNRAGDGSPNDQSARMVSPVTAVPHHQFWRDADWLGCRDGKWRPVEPGTFPLAHGSPARVVRLRGYGNGLVAPQATVFIEAVMDQVRAGVWT